MLLMAFTSLFAVEPTRIVVPPNYNVTTYSYANTYGRQQTLNYLNSVYPEATLLLNDIPMIHVFVITYPTIKPGGQKVLASGVMLKPVSRTITNKPLVEYIHGTLTSNNEAPSKTVRAGFNLRPDIYVHQHILRPLFLAAQGYTVIIPDQLGYGASNGIPHPYLNAQWGAQTAVDMIAAVKNTTLSSKVFVTGYSEGGHAAYATQRMLETMANPPKQVIGCVAAAGPYDLVTMAGAALQYDLPTTTPLLAFFILTANSTDGWNRPMNTIFNAPYDTLVPELFNNKHPYEDTAVLNVSPFQVFKMDFLQGFLSGQDTQVVSYLQRQTVLPYVPNAPICFFASGGDDLVPPDLAWQAFGTLTQNGTVNMDKVFIAPLDNTFSLINVGTHEANTTSQAYVLTVTQMLNSVNR